MVEEFLVLVEEGFALGGVGDEDRGLGLELDRRRKAATAGADDAELVDTVKRGVETGGNSPGSARLWRHDSDFLPKSAKIAIDSDD
jgi:hypothetical protein